MNYYLSVKYGVYRMDTKALYLEKGFYINKPNKGKAVDCTEKFQNFNENDLNPNDTYTLDFLIKNLNKVVTINSISDQIYEGLKICKVFRNKEGHIAVHWHEFDIEDYKKIEYSIKKIYEIGFAENLDFEISMTKDQKNGNFEIKR